jgi:TRAP-type uncharacterized transport system substrate-binding protein
VVMACILCAALLAALQPLPSRQLVMATGPPGSAYARAGERYREILARDGVRLRLVPTNGAVENVKLLQDRTSGISVGFSQAGGVDDAVARDVVSLGTVFNEAVWVFCRCPDRPLALKLLALNGFDTRQLQIFEYSPEEAAQALLAKKLDAVLMLTAWESPVVQSLARAPDITLHEFSRADAYIALDPRFNKVVLPRGVADLANDRPPRDTTLIASKASLVVRKDVHPALQYLLLRAAMEVHARAGMFHRAGEFPAAEEIDLPLSTEARDMYRGGPSFLQRSLPFWLAELVQRMLILVVPVVGIVYPLWSFVPRFYRWQTERRIFNIYGDLMRLEQELRRAPSAAGLANRLDDLDRRVLDLRLPAAYGEMTYNLKAHIRALRGRVEVSS